jgi:hypothetical protein
MDPDFRRTKGVKYPRDRKLSKKAIKNRASEKAKARWKQSKATYNGSRKADFPDQITVNKEEAEELYYRELCYTDGQRKIDAWADNYMCFGSDDFTDVELEMIMPIVEEMKQTRWYDYYPFPPWRQ